MIHYLRECPLDRTCTVDKNYSVSTDWTQVRRDKAGDDLGGQVEEMKQDIGTAVWHSGAQCLLDSLIQQSQI